MLAKSSRKKSVRRRVACGSGMDHAAVDAFLRAISEQHGVKLGDLAQPMRLAVTGRMVSAGLFDVMAILPWDVVEARLRKVETL